jgi:hypothetical protein
MGDLESQYARSLAAASSKEETVSMDNLSKWKSFGKVTVTLLQVVGPFLILPFCAAQGMRDFAALLAA